MFLLNWYRDYLELKREYKQVKPCESCETLKVQVEQLRYDNDKLLDRMLEKPSAPTQIIIPDNITPIKTRQHIPWRVRQQTLEAEDRQKAKLMRDAPKPEPVSAETTTEELEQEVLNAERAREAEAK